MKNLCVLFFFVVASSCQMMPWNSKPTVAMEESVNVFAYNTVIVDTRSGFDYASFHIPGSINLESSQFLILKNPLKGLRIMDPDLVQIIERLARRGVSPEKKVILISQKANSDENKKWQWLLRNLQIEDISVTSLEEFRKKFPNRQFAEPTRSEVWALQISEDLQNEFILKKSSDCFVTWSDKKCHKNF